MKSLSNNSLKNTYNNLQKNRKRIKTRAIIFTIFLFGVNIFAWFIYISSANVRLDANIISWDITFSDNNVEEKEMIIKSTDLYPGMQPFEKELQIKNKSEVDAVFAQEIKGLNLKGENVPLTGMSIDEINNYLQNYYPFKITLSADKDVIAKGETINYKINISWEYENTNNYYKLNNLYLYDKLVDYYTFNGTSYIKDQTVSDTNFSDKVLSGIYLEKDDADNFWGETCTMYKKTVEDACINLKLKLIVTQKEV